MDVAAPPLCASAPDISIMKWIVGVALLLVVAVVGYLGHVASQIQNESTVDEEHPADAIVVLGAAEYRWPSSPFSKRVSTTPCSYISKDSLPASSRPAAREAIPSSPRAPWLAPT